MKQAAAILRADAASKVIITGGELAYGGTGTHHALVADALNREGIGHDRILARLDKAAHTADEAFDSFELLKQVAYDSLIVVTSFVHYPRAPFVFAHFHDLTRLRFVLAPDASAKDVTLFNYLHEFEAYQEDRRRGGIVLRDGTFVPTTFTYDEFTELLRHRILIKMAGMRDYEMPESREINLFA
ncbi:MAG: YdcF family protein, partial [Pseudomonadales bacterium]|nr:YdcF family protein [Pseudomonadales bacterium]